MPPKLSPQDAARSVRQALAAKADPVQARGVERYFKAYETVKCYGVAAPDIHALAAELYGRVKADWTVDDAIELCDILFADPELEAKAVGGPRPRPVQEDLPSGPLRQGQRLAGRRPARQLGLRRQSSARTPWAPSSSATRPSSRRSRPGLATPTAGSSGPRSCPSSSWPARRSSSRRSTRSRPRSFPVDDDLVHKANGWLLREAGKADPARLEKFLLAHGPAIPRTTVRYAIERFPEAKRKALLLKTKPTS